jgi:hypothetical protein
MVKFRCNSSLSTLKVNSASTRPNPSNQKVHHEAHFYFLVHNLFVLKASPSVHLQFSLIKQ